MAQRPTFKQTKPLTAPVDPQRLEADAVGLAGARVLGDVKAEVSPEAAPLWEFVLTHARAIALAVLGVIVLIIAVAAWQWYRESAAASARDDLGRIAASLDPAARLKALEDFAADAPSSVYLAAQLELARAAVESENWDKAAAAYAAVAERDPDSPLAFSARFNRADVLLRQGKAAEAATELETLLSQAPDNLKPFLNEQIGEAAEAAGRKDKAIAAYQAAVKELTSIAPAEAAYYQDRIAKLQ